LILLDIRLSDISGFDVCRKLRSEGSSIPIIMLTARDEELDKVLGLELGADDYVVKPYTVRELVSHIREKLRRAYGEFATMSDDDRIRFGFSPIVVRPRPDIPYGEAAAASMRDRDHSMMESVLWQLLFEEYQETILEFLGEA
jgi:DNA-binding response OmpR family regulator